MILVHVTDPEIMERIRKLTKELDYSLSRYGYHAIKRQLLEDERNRLGESDGNHDE